MAEPKTTGQTIEQLRKRYEDLKDDKIKAETNYENAREQLGKLKAAALKDHGTDDLETLRGKLKEMEADNDRKRKEYEAHLNKIEADLKDVDKKFAQPQGQK